MPKVNAEQHQIKVETLMKDLVNTFGDGSTISRKEFLDFHQKNVDKYPNSGYITNNPKYRIGRAQYKIVLDKTIKKKYSMKELVDIVFAKDNEPITQDEINNLCGSDDIKTLI